MAAHGVTVMATRARGATGHAPQTLSASILGRQTLILDDWPMPAIARALSPNGRAHPLAVHRAKRQAAERVAIAHAISPLVPMRGPVRITLVYVFPRAGRHDRDNYVAIGKPVLDALVKLGILPDDSSDVVTGIDVEFAVERWQRRLEIEIREA